MDNLNIAEINRNLQESFIHYEPNRVDYTINDSELSLLEQAGSSIWKDIFLATLGLGVPSLINAICDFNKLAKKSPITIDIFINFLVAGVCLCLSLICAIVWKKNNKTFKGIITQIKEKPKYKLPNNVA